MFQVYKCQPSYILGWEVPILETEEAEYAIEVAMEKNEEHQKEFSYPTLIFIVKRKKD